MTTSGMVYQNNQTLFASQWQAALSELKLQMPRGTFDTWVKDTIVLGCEQDSYVIGTPNAFVNDWLENRLGPTMRRILSTVVGRGVEVRFVVRTREAAEPAQGDPPPAAAAAPAPLLNVRPVPDELEPASVATRHNGNGASNGQGHRSVQARRQPLNGIPESFLAPTLSPRHTFDSFIVGSANRVAHAVARSVAEHPGEAYNPLFLYGEVGLGKTHLLQAIARELQLRDLRVVYVSSEAFTNDLIGALRTQGTEAFREKYRTCDALLIDDIQFIADKERTQEEFFHTFNTLHANNRQVVVSSDRPPRSISLLEDRLRSRFEGGLTADLKPPDLETRVAILQHRANSQPAPIPADVLMLIAQRVQTNIRELEGAFTRVIAQARALHKPITLDLAAHVLDELAPARPKPTADGILRAICAHYRLELNALLSASRRRDLAWPRQVAMYLLRAELDLSLPQIGQTLGGRDHTTVMHGVEKVSRQMSADESARQQINEVRRMLAPA